MWLKKKLFSSPFEILIFPASFFSIFKKKKQFFVGICILVRFRLGLFYNITFLSYTSMFSCTHLAQSMFGDIGS